MCKKSADACKREHSDCLNGDVCKLKCQNIHQNHCLIPNIIQSTTRSVPGCPGTPSVTWCLTPLTAPSSTPAREMAGEAGSLT